MKESGGSCIDFIPAFPQDESLFFYLRHDGLPADFKGKEKLKRLRLYFRASACCDSLPMVLQINNENDSVARRKHHLVQPCPMIGGTGPQLAPAQERTIRAILDAHWESWMCEEPPQPCESNVYDAASPSPPPSLAVVMPRNIENDPAYIEHDISFHMTRTARTAGFETTFFAADAITYSGSEGYHDEFTKLVSFLEAGKPNIVAIDGNYRPNNPATIFTFKRALSPDDMAKLRLQFGFQLIVVIPDCHDLAPGNLSDWGPVADLVVTFHKDSESYRSFPTKEKVLVCPSIPFAAELFTPREKKDIGLSYIGSDTRERSTFMAAAEAAGLDTLIRMHDRRRETAPDTEEFASLLARSHLSFNNGWQSEGPAIITGRVAETILAGGVLVQEIGSALDDYLVPFVHYVPVSNTHQLVAYSRFLLAHDEHRTRIADEGRKFWLEHYRSERFWAKALAILCSERPAHIDQSKE